jgi:hypothetical protein
MAHLREARAAERDEELKHHVAEHKHAAEIESRPKVVGMKPKHAVSHNKEASEAMADKDLRAMIQEQNKKDDSSRVTAHYDELPADGIRPMVRTTPLPVPRNADGSENVGAWYQDRQHRLTGALFEQRAQMQGILDQLHALHASADTKTKSKLETLAGASSFCFRRPTRILFSLVCDSMFLFHFSLFLKALCKRWSPTLRASSRSS